MIEKYKNLIINLLTLAIFIFTYIYIIYDINNSYWMLGDQTRDWRIASSNQIHLVGTPIITGGYSFGPFFYWVLQFIYHNIGPFFNYLPHTAVYGLTFFNAIANAILFYIMAKKYFPSIILIFSLILFYITSPLVASLASTSWNPNLSAAFVNLSLALLIYKDFFKDGFNNKNIMSVSIIILFSWIAVQCHSPAIFYAASIFLFIFIKTVGIKNKFLFFALSALIVLILQIPFIIYMLNNSNQIANYQNGTTLAFKRFLFFKGAFGQGFSYIFNTASYSTLNKFYFPPFLIVYISLFIIAFYKKLFKEPIVQFFLIVLLLCYYGYSCLPSWSRESYLILANIFPLVILPIFILLKEFFNSKKINYSFHIAFLAIVILIIPSRNAERDTHFPYYKIIKIASKDLYEKHKELRAITLPNAYNKIDSSIIYEGYGGKINPKSSLVASIDEDGNIKLKNL
ncbi:hypothetical protein [Fluviispira sanaruensis]|uniref:Glycosyltransferase RgtA/B/C/D-like domain-containing protein n=1 Tax=Fluviispira sanaruensis TaxID=2493639 RepID=A0A4P2VIQ8_FLUSA|nr:hypothetical protein [Fluviispira sanaruensis]BBH51764.1 hypothetical protein JCM31447_01820 [Fluviispira sanaruensis]